MVPQLAHQSAVERDRDNPLQGIHDRDAVGSVRERDRVLVAILGSPGPPTTGWRIESCDTTVPLSEDDFAVATLEERVQPGWRVEATACLMVESVSHSAAVVVDNRVANLFDALGDAGRPATTQVARPFGE